MQLAGSGVIPAGEYNEKISISGSGRIQGNVRCTALSVAGSASAQGSVWCEEDMKASGSARMEHSLHAKNVHISGSCHVGEDCTAEEMIKAAGSFRCGGNVRCHTLRAAGNMQASSVEAEDVKISGGIDCAGLLNAERIEIRIERASSRVGSIGGSDIKIYSEGAVGKIIRMPLLSKMLGHGVGGVDVTESIEGDTIAIERVSTPLVVGRIVAIGADCCVDLVQYSETIEIHPDAKVGRYEKIG